MISSRVLRSSVIGLVGAVLAVVSIYCVWFQFSGYALTGVQLDESFHESFSYSLFVGAVYFCLVFVVAGMVFVMVKPYEQLVVRGLNAAFLFVALLVASVPLFRLFDSQSFSLDSLKYFQYGFWVFVGSVGLLFCSWAVSLSEIWKIHGKFELLRDKIKGFLNEVASEIEVSVFAKKCGVSEKLLMDVWEKFKDKEFKDFFVTNGKIVSKQWLRETLKERLM
ncbi:MAG: hypothetical protein QXU46_02205 [Candidatus Bathyarchaeia archaeon]